jgi:hypothetical protein
MKVLVLQALAGSKKPYPIQKGEQDLPNDVAMDLISRGLANPLEPVKVAEKAINKKPVQKRTRRKK